MQRGEVWWVNFPPPVGRRPAVLLSRQAAYSVRTSVTVGPATRTVRGIRVEVRLVKEDGMPMACALNLDDIQTVPLTSLDKRITTLSSDKLDAVASAIRYALDLP